MEPVAAYSPDRSLKGKLRRRVVRLQHRRPVRLALERPMVTFSFDDAPVTAAETGAALLEAGGLRGTYYVAAGLAGRDGPMGRYATRADAERLAAAGHEIACHTYSHLDCGKAGAAQIAADVARNGEALGAWGVSPVSFAYPYGDVSLQAKQTLGGLFATLRGVHKGVVTDGCDANQLPAVGIEGAHGEAVAMRYLEAAKAKAGWLILYTHDVAGAPSQWGCTPATLERLVDRAQALGFDAVTAAEGARRAGL